MSLTTMPRKIRTSKRGRQVIGLEIEPGRVAAAQVTVNGAIHISRAVSAELPEGAVRDGEVIDAAAVSSALKELWADNKHLDRAVRVGVASAKIVVRTIDVPVIDDEADLAAAVRFVAAQELPMPLDSAVLDFHVLGTVETPEGARRRVLLVAARRDMIEAVLTAVRGAGLKPVGIDLSAFAMVRVLGGTSPDAAVYLSLSGLTNVAVVVDGICVFTRVAAGGLETMAVELAERRSLTIAHARMWLQHVGLQQDIAEIDGDAEIVQDTRTVLVAGVQRIANDVRASLEYQSSQPGGTTHGEIVLTGTGLAIPGLTVALETELGVPVRERSVQPDASAADEIDLAGATVAAGLALEEAVA